MNDSDLIDALGGTTAVARMFGIKPPSVSEWRETGIPRSRLQYLQLLRPDLWGADSAQAQTAKAA